MEMVSKGEHFYFKNGNAICEVMSMLKCLKNFDTLPEQMKKQILDNSRDMNRFYTLPLEQRQAVLDRIAQLNTEEEIRQYLKK